MPYRGATMSEADPVRRTKSAARRAAGPVPVETQRRWHFDELRNDLKLGEFAPAPPPEPSRPLFRTLVLVAVVFVATDTVLLAQTGTVQRYIAQALQPATETRRDPPVFAPGPAVTTDDQINAPPSLVEPTPALVSTREADAQDDNESMTAITNDE